ncbi:MAG: type II toxin-antitoxin system RelE/ParE family toxin [Proteobacteria bacterium]|nr:type II toxin-antitoxin system RelE/ParE family toxin [Pseudomonadota bacterium]
MKIEEKEVRIYCRENGSCPYFDWFNSISNERLRQIIQARLARLRLGNLGFCRSLGDGVFELKIDFQAGYRIYFGNDSLGLVILISAGDKSSQNEDIKKAKGFWKDYKQRKASENP